MIKKNYYLFITILFSPSFLLSMELSLSSKMGTVSTAVCITEEIAAAGSDIGCFLIFNPTKPSKSIAYLHRNPTHNLITDKKNKLGALCNDCFIVYDVKTKKVIWSQRFYDNFTNYSAAFSNVDDTIFVCHNSRLTSNTHINTTLPYTGSNQHFSIECHPTKNELLYPCSDTAIGTRSFGGEQSTQIPFSNIKGIRRAFYSPDGSYIAIQTNERQLYIYHPSTKTVKHIVNIGDYCYYSYNNPIFLPYTNSLLAFVCDRDNIHFWDIHNHKEIATLKIKDANYRSYNLLTNMLDFSPESTYYSIGINKFHAEVNPVPVINLKLLFYKYLLLKAHSDNNNNYLPLDIIQLFIKWICAISTIS